MPDLQRLSHFDGFPHITINYTVNDFNLNNKFRSSQKGS